MKRAIKLLIATILSMIGCGGTPTAHAATVFSNYGAGNSACPPTFCSWWDTGWHPNEQPYYRGMPFTVDPGTSFTLDSVALTVFNAQSLYPPFITAPTLIVSINASSGGLPGTVLEQFTFSNFSGNDYTQPVLLTGTSVLHPALAAGTQYWVTTAASNPTSMVVGWLFNGVGSSGISAWHAGSAPWTPVGNANAPVTLGVFSVNGTPLSPPQSSPADLAKQVVGGDYELGAKGWDVTRSLNGWVMPDAIKTSGYHWEFSDASTVDNALDCSGLVMWAYNRAAGATKFETKLNDPNGNPVIYQGADGQYRNNTLAVNESDLKPGDLMFFDWNSDGQMDHVAMYVGCCNGPDGAADLVSAADPTSGVIWAHKDRMKTYTISVGGHFYFGRITTPNVGVRFTIHSPIQLIVTDPDGFTIAPDTLIVTAEERLREIPGVLYYSESDINGDGNIDATVYAPTLKSGPYVIRVIPKPGALPTDTYGLEMEVAGKTITLAQNVPVQSIPSGGYGVASTGSDITAFTPVALLDGRHCDGVFEGSFSGNVAVSHGQSCTLVNGDIKGSISVNGGSLSLLNTSVGGNVAVDHGTMISVGVGTAIHGNVKFADTRGEASVCGARIDGNVEIHGSEASVQIGSLERTACPGSTLGGNVSIEDGHDTVAFDENSVRGNAKIHNNRPSVEIFNNAVGGNLDCSGNAVIEGAQNSAKKKQGQCAQF